MNHCAIARENEGNPKWSQEYLDACYAAFGGDTNDWVGRVLTVQVENSSVGGKRVKVLYLIPEGFALSEDQNGYLVIVPEDKAIAPVTPSDDPGPQDADNTEDIPWED